MLILQSLIFVSTVFLVQASVYSVFIKDFVQFLGKSTTVTEFSCNKKESAKLFKALATTGYHTKIQSIQTVDIEYPIPPNHHVYVLKLDCPDSKELIKAADTFKLFTAPLKWVCYYQRDQLSLDDVIETYFKNINVLLDSDVNLAEEITNNKVVVRNIFRKRQNFTITVEETGIWTPTNGFSKNESFEVLTAKRRKDLSGVTLNSCIVITNPDSLNHLTDKRDKHIDSIAKVNYVLVEHLSNINNVSLNYSIQSTWGYKTDSEWSGMIGELTRNEADIGGTPLFFTTDRVDIIDYISMTTPTRSKFIFREPKLSYVTNVYTLPFDTKVWTSTICLVILTAIILYIVVKWEWIKKKYEKTKDTSNCTELKDSLLESSFLAFGAFCQQGAASVPFSFPGRITTIFLFLSLMFLYTSYSANIVALLQSSSTSIKTLEDLLKSRLQVGVDDTVFNHFYFSHANEPIRKALYKQKVAPPGKKDNFMVIHEGIRRMRRGLFAFHVETGPGYKIVSETFKEDEKCGIQEIQYLQVPDPWLAVQKNSSYKEMLKVGLRLIRESGIQAREVGLIYTKKPACTSKSSTFINVGLVDCYAAFAILGGGILAAAMVFIFEFYINHRKHFYQRWARSNRRF